jgi:hypothetical protein
MIFISLHRKPPPKAMARGSAARRMERISDIDAAMQRLGKP